MPASHASFSYRVLPRQTKTTGQSNFRDMRLTPNFHGIIKSIKLVCQKFKTELKHK